MDRAQAITNKQEHPTTHIPNVKFEPTDNLDEPRQLKIIKVFTVPSVAVNKSSEKLNSINSSPTTFLEKEPLPDTINNDIEIVHENTTSEKRYSLRKRSVQSYDEDALDLNFPIPNKQVRNTKQNTKAAKKQIQRKRDKPNFSPPARNKKQNCESTKEQEIITCDFCSTVFFTVESLEEHVVEIHVVDKEFKCDECSKSFISQDELDSHMAEHESDDEEPGGHKCPVCFRIFAFRNYVVSHMMSHEKSFQCKICSNRYPRKLDLDRHEMNQHGKEKAYKCPKCPKSFCRDYVLQDHIRTHSKEKTIVCENCGNRYKTKVSLRNHRPFCSGTSSQNKLHKRTKKKQSKGCNTAENKQKGPNYKYRQYECNVCDYVCKSRCNLIDHMLSHSDDRNCKCDLCPAAFKRKIELSRHQKKKHHQKLKTSEVSI